MNEVNKLARWVIDKIEREYKDDIALLVAVFGHSTDGDLHGESFDYFVPATKRGYELSQTFIIDGVGHDLYPRSWERMEKTAQLNDFPTLCLAGAKILYSRTKEDEERFVELQTKLIANLNNPMFTYGKALENLDDAMDIYRTMMFEEKVYKARMASSFITYYLTKTTALINGSFADEPIYTQKQALNTTLESRMYHCPDMKEVPENFYVYGSRLLKTKSMEEIKHLTYLMIESCRRFVSDHKPAEKEKSKDINYKNLADWYQELSLTWKRIRFYSDHNMVEEAYADASNLQQQLIIVAEEFEFDEMDLLGYFDPEHLEHLKERSIELEKYIRTIILSHGASINEYASLKEFLKKN